MNSLVIFALFWFLNAAGQSPDCTQLEIVSETPGFRKQKRCRRQSIIVLVSPDFKVSTFVMETPQQGTNNRRASLEPIGIDFEESSDGLDHKHVDDVLTQSFPRWTYGNSQAMTQVVEDSDQSNFKPTQTLEESVADVSAADLVLTQTFESCPLTETAPLRQRTKRNPHFEQVVNEATKRFRRGKLALTKKQ